MRWRRASRPVLRRTTTRRRRDDGTRTAAPTRTCESRRRCGPSPAADVGRVSAQMRAESRRRCEPSPGGVRRLVARRRRRRKARAQLPRPGAARCRRHSAARAVGLARGARIGEVREGRARIHRAALHVGEGLGGRGLSGRGLSGRGLSGSSHRTKRAHGVGCSAAWGARDRSAERSRADTNAQQWRRASAKREIAQREMPKWEIAQGETPKWERASPRGTHSAAEPTTRSAAERRRPTRWRAAPVGARATGRCRRRSSRQAEGSPGNAPTASAR